MTISSRITDRRLPPRPTEVIDRNKPISFEWDGKPYRGYAGDTIVSALYASGVGIFSRSFKYHRPRSVMAASYLDPGCTVQVGEEPNVRGAHRLLEDGMNVSSQNNWPSLRFDVGGATDLIGGFLTAGFYYKTFIKPQRLWPAYEKVLARFASGGRIIDDGHHGDYDHRYAHPDVLVAGGGPAGMEAAVAAAAAGASVMLVEEEHDLGGHLRYDPAAAAKLAELRRSVGAQANIEVLTDSVVNGRYDDNWVAVMQRRPGPVSERLVKARANVLVVAAGLIERPYVFAGNDKPGVMLSGGVRRLVNLWAVKPGERAVVFGANEEGDRAAADLAGAGVDIARVVDARKGEGIVRAVGEKIHVRGVELTNGKTIDCDLLVTAVGWTAPTSLLNMAGDRPVYDSNSARFFSSRLPENVMVTGGLAGDGTLEQLSDHARAVGKEAARRALSTRRRLQAARPWAAPVEGPEPSDQPIPLPGLARLPHPALFQATTHGMVDFCEDVSSKDLVAAAAEGFDSIELVKRFTTVTMGPTQGKLETVNAVAVLASARDETIEQVGTTVWRPPYAPITLGALGGHIVEPVRYSPMQPWHEAHGAVALLAGQWIRVDHYGDPAAEVRNVRQNVGIIDVTPLGKLDLVGPDVAKLLNLLYVNKWSKLDVGGVRYGVMCAEDGVVLDDGVTGRLDNDHYLMTTTTSGAGTVWEWVENWLQTEHPDWRVHVTPVSTAYASMNVAGPASRELLSRLTERIDLSPDAFPYMNVRKGSVAGVDSFMWRIGFTGELSYEIHVPSAFGLHVWESLMAAGADLGVGAFGVEAQRIMRLEKGHFIISQDTDGLTQGYGAGLSWLIKTDKDDFAGKPELVWQSTLTEFPRLVGLQPVDPNLVPPEASQIIENGSVIVGRITSSRFSPTLNRSICLGFVAPHLAAAGTVVTVRLPDRRRVEATVMAHHAHFDPEGTRLRG
jgi:sarcosine oxidase subunit alpha